MIASPSITAPSPAAIPISFRAACLGIDAVKSALGVSEDRLHELIESGQFSWVLNIGSKKSKRRLIRILTACVHCVQAGRRQPFFLPEEIGPAVFGEKRPVVRAVGFAAALACSEEHVGALICKRELPGRIGRRGRGGDGTIRWEDACKFLSARRIT